MGTWKEFDELVAVLENVAHGREMIVERNLAFRFRQTIMKELI